MTINEQKRQFWNERSALPANSGSDDFILKGLEQKFLLDTIPAGSHVLDMGSGDGQTLALMQEKLSCTGLGLDFSDGMVELAQSTYPDRAGISFQQASLLDLPEDIGPFDVIYTQRCLINLDTFEQQAEAIEALRQRLKPGGTLIMIESTHEGLEATNTLRRQFNLPELEIPWHNTFFQVSEIEKLAAKGFEDPKVVEVSSTYYFLSRVVYAKLAADKNESLHYDSDINLLSCDLPQNIGAFGSVKALIWRRAP